MKKLICLIIMTLFIISGCSSSNHSLKNIDVGDTITFGRYEQDNDSSNGEEGIEWIVLAKDDNSALVISKYALYSQTYHSVDTDVTWEKCTLRNWMNSLFLYRAFDEEERNNILNTKVHTDNNQQFDTDPGNDTKDKIFILSVTEVEQYMPANQDRVAKATVYAMNCAGYVDENANWSWWLRTPGTRGKYAAFVNVDGSIYWEGTDVVSVNYMVRPAMWIKI